MTEAEDYLWELRHTALFRAELSTLYHRKRERFFALLDRGGKALALIAGTAAFSSLLTSADSKSWAGMMVALATLPGLVFAWSDKARLHAELAHKFTQIQAEIVGTGERDFEEKQINEWQAKIRQLEATEPPTLSALVRLCQNQLAIANGQPEKVHPLTRIERCCVHLFDMSLGRRVTLGDQSRQSGDHS